jgi:hypothetical protein
MKGLKKFDRHSFAGENACTDNETRNAMHVFVTDPASDSVLMARVW